MVYPGDTVVVPKAAVVYVLGDVLKPGGYPISTNNSKMTVLQAIALAGYANHTAAVGKSRLVRETATGSAGDQPASECDAEGQEAGCCLAARRCGLCPLQLRAQPRK